MGERHTFLPVDCACNSISWDPCRGERARKKPKPQIITTILIEIILIGMLMIGNNHNRNNSTKKSNNCNNNSSNSTKTHPKPLKLQGASLGGCHQHLPNRTWMTRNSWLSVLLASGP